MGELPVEIRLLGRFLVLRDGEEIPAAAFGGRKVRALLRVLATRRGSFVSHDVLTEALWPARPPADPAANLGVLVNRARRALAEPALILTGHGGYALAGQTACTVDAETVTADVRAAQQAAVAGDDRAALRLFRAALDAWAGEPLAEDAYADWAAELRARLQRVHQDALEGGAKAALALDEAAVAVELAAAAAAAEPMREVAVLALVQALAAGGDHAAALARFAEYRRTLADELGLDPTPEAEALHVRLLRGEGTGAPVGKRVARQAVAPDAQPVGGEFAELRFVGRADELAAVLGELGEESGSHGAVLVRGGAGTGKSRLLAEVAARVGLPVLAAKAFLPERAEPWGLARSVLREALAMDLAAADAVPGRAGEVLAELLPELSDGAASAGSVAGAGSGAGRGALDPESRRALVREAALRILTAVAADGAVLLLDDLQWADSSSLMLIGSALARLPRLRCVLAVRPDELDRGSAAAFLAELGARRQVREIELAPLDSAAIDELVADPDLAKAMAAGAEPTPFAVAEVLRALAGRGAIGLDRTGRWHGRSADAVGLAAELAASGQRRAVQARSARYAGLAGEVLALVALLSRQTSARVLAAAAGTAQPEVLDALATLAGAGLLRLGEQGWMTAHDLVSETIIAGLGAAERGRLHALLARALEADGAEPSEVARHHASAGDVDAAAAAFELAARRAVGDSANREAVALADTGLALQPRSALRWALLDVRAQARARRGDLAGARADLRDALAGQPPGPTRSRLLARLAMQSAGSDDLLRAAELAELALVEAGGDETARAHALDVAAILDMNLEQPERAQLRADEALSLYQRIGDAGGVARIMDGRAMATFLDGRIREATELLGRVAGLFADSGDLLRVITPRSTRGHGMVFRGRPNEGLVDTDAALELARTLGDPEGQAYALWHRSEALSGLERFVEAESAGRESLDIARRLGHRGWTATGLRAVGIALAGQGELGAAEDAFRGSLATAEHLSLFASWAAARLALILIARGRLESAEPLVARALEEGPPLGHYEGQLARVELAAARGERAASGLAAAELARAEAGGHIASVLRLAEVAGLPPR